MALCQKQNEFSSAASCLLELVRRHHSSFVIATIEVLAVSSDQQKFEDPIYILPQIWKRISGYLRNADIFFLNKNTITLAVTDVETQHNARQFCERMIELLSDDYVFDHKTYTARFHIGLSEFPEDASTVTEMIEHASSALSTIDSMSNRIAFY